MNGGGYTASDNGLDSSTYSEMPILTEVVNYAWTVLYITSNHSGICGELKLMWYAKLLHSQLEYQYWNYQTLFLSIWRAFDHL